MFQLDDETGLFKGTLKQFLEHFCSLEEAAIKLHGSADEPVILIETPEVFDRRVRIMDGEVVTVLCEENMEPTGGLDSGTLFSRMSVSKRYGRGLRSCPGCYSIVVVLEGDVVTVCKPTKCAMCLRARYDVPKTDYQWKCNLGTSCTCDTLTPCLYYKDKVLIEEQDNPFDKQKLYVHINDKGVNIRRKDARLRIKKVNHDCWKLLSYSQVKHLLDKSITTRLVGIEGPLYDRLLNGKAALRRIRKREAQLLRSAGAKSLLLEYNQVMHVTGPAEDWWVNGCYISLDLKVASFSMSEIKGYVYVYCKREHNTMCKDLVFNGACCHEEVPFISPSILLQFCIDEYDPVPASIYSLRGKERFISIGAAGWSMYKHVVTLAKSLSR